MRYNCLTADKVVFKAYHWPGGSAGLEKREGGRGRPPPPPGVDGTMAFPSKISPIFGLF